MMHEIGSIIHSIIIFDCIRVAFVQLWDQTEGLPRRGQMGAPYSRDNWPWVSQVRPVRNRVTKTELAWTVPLLATCFPARDSTRGGKKRKHLEEHSRLYHSSDFDKMSRLFMQSGI
jgi:hypothetical protein